MTQEPMRLKWGVGRLIWECEKTPIVLPLWHVGMEKILPNYEPYYPRSGNKVTINVGEPIQLENIVNSLRDSKAEPLHARKIITDKIQDELMALKPVTENLHNEWTCS